MEKLFNDFIAGLTENSVRRYKTVLEQFAKFLKTSLQEASAREVIQYSAELKKKKLAGATIRNSIEILRSYYNYLQKMGEIEVNPVERAALRLPHKFFNQKRPTKIVPFEHVKAFCDAPSRHTKAGIRDRGILACLFGGGLRKSEVLNLSLDDVRIHETEEKAIYYLRLVHTKAGHPDEQAIPDWAAERVTRVVENRISEGANNSDPLFVHYYKDGRCKNKSLFTRTFDRIFTFYRREIGLPDTITPHSARATAISQLLALGIPIREVQKFARHASVTTTELYDKRYFGVENSVAKKLRYA